MSISNHDRQAFLQLLTYFALFAFFNSSSAIVMVVLSLSMATRYPSSYPSSYPSTYPRISIHTSYPVSASCSRALLQSTPLSSRSRVWLLIIVNIIHTCAGRAAIHISPAELFYSLANFYTSGGCNQ